ncbi:hypothetical protein ABH926_007417 [Catenulispora sp. GP43]|uniref:hypothetical protein n=1 Tax=Catenulispora sp. GP43 TaxID=3156263 RepID=UPI003519B0AB
MRKIASLAALTLCVVAGGASAASADVSIGPLPLGPDATTAPPAPGTLTFAKTWCGAPWLWSQQQPGADCTAQHDGGAPAQ